MFEALDIKEVTGRTILDSSANPAVEAEVVLMNGAHGRASASLKNASQVRKETALIRDLLSEAILFQDASNQKNIDRLLLQSVKNKQWKNNSSMGVLVLSMAAARAAGAGLGLPLYRYLGGTSAPVMPVPMMNMIRVGNANEMDFGEIMVVPKSPGTYKEGLRMGVEIYQTLKRLLSIKKTTVSDMKNSEEALDYLIAAMKLCGCRPGEDAMIAVNGKTGPGGSVIRGRRELMDYPGNGMMIKMEQAGTVTQTLEMVKKARNSGYKVIITNDFGGTEESFIADMAAAAGADYIKSGAPCRGACTAKDNELIRIEEFYKKRYCIYK